MSIPDRERQAYDAIIEHFTEVGEKCLEEDRAPTQAEQDKLTELDAAHKLAVTARRQVEGYTRMLEGRAY